MKRTLIAIIPGLLALVSCAQMGVTLGDERLDEYFPLLEGKRVAVFSNQTGIVGQSGKHVLDVLVENGFNVTAVFSPEHGFRGNADAGEKVGDSSDPKTGVPILSLYGGGSMTDPGRPRYMPSEEAMDAFDILVIDIQDVGLRYYTYYITMCHLMEACSMDGKQVILLDRPNPNGFYVDGPILDTENLRSGVGWLPITVVHGMTLGELALMINGEGWLEGRAPCELTVIPCLGYTHQTRYELPVAPSPNLKDMQAIYLYASTCYFEGTVMSVGRGTDKPFKLYGHPDMPETGFSFTPVSMPGAKEPPLMGQKCNGVDLSYLSNEDIWDKGLDLSYIIDAYHKMGLPPGQFFTRMFDKEIGVEWVREEIVAGKSAEEIREMWQDDVEKFKEQRKKYLLYDE